MARRTRTARRASTRRSSPRRPSPRRAVDRRTVGVDIGATAVRAAVVSSTTSRGVTTVGAKQLASVPLPTGTVVNGSVVNEGAITAALKRLWSDNKIRTSSVILGTTSPQVTVREFSMPSLPPDQMRQALPFQAREAIALPLDRALLDFCPIGPPDQADGRVNGLLMALPREPVLRAVRAVEKAKLTVARVDLAPFGLLRSIGSAGSAPEALVDIGANLTTIVVHADGKAAVVRVVTHGGGAWTEFLADQADLSMAEAEEAQRVIGLRGTTLPAKLLRETVRPVINEIRNSVTFFSSQHQAPVERVVLTGGTGAMPGLAALLSDKLSIPVVAATPLQHLASTPAPARRRTHGGNDGGNSDGGNSDGGNDGDRFTTRASAVAVGLAMGVAA